MSWDFHPVENEQALADMKPLADIEPGFFSGMQWAPYQINRGFAVAGRALSLATSTPFILADKIRGGTELQDRYFHDVHEAIYQRAVDFWTPNPKEVGTAARVVGDLISTLPMAIAAPPLAILSAQMGTAEDLVRAGVPEGKAQAVGAIQGAGMGLGIWMPILGKNLWQRTVVGGAGFNTLQGVVTRGASGAILEGTPAEDQFKAFDGEAMTLDVLLGLGFGAFTHINPDARAQGAEAWDRAAKWAERFSPSQKAAIATLREAQHLNVDSTPGKPVAHADIEAHVNRMRTSMDQLANDKPVQVEDMPAPKMEPDPVREQENIQRTADMINIAERIREEEGLPRLDDLNAAGKTVTERLLDLGIPAEEAQSKGLLFDSFFGTMAKHTNSTPEELMARYFGGISKDEGDGAGGMAEGNVDRLHSAIARYLGTENSPFELTPETPADIAARVRDAELAAQGDTEAQQRIQSRAAADVLREHFLGKKGGVPTPDKSSISQGLPHNGMQERPEVRADESGSLEEPAQSGSGAGNATNPNDIPAHVQEAVLKAVNKVQDADRKWAMEHEIRDEVVNTGAVSIKDLLKKERAEIQISEVTGLERTRFGWTASVRGEKITVPGSYSKKTAPQAIADAYAIDHGKVSASDLIDPETEELTDAGFEALNKATDAEIEARANAAFGKIESLDELNSVDHRTQWEAMKALVGQFGLDSKADASSGGSRYLTVEIGDESYKIRFADHFNTVRDSTMQPDFNVAPGRNTFTDAVEWLIGKLKRSDNINFMAADQSAAATKPNSAAAGESGTGTLTLEQFSRIFDESRWLDRGLKVGGKTKLYRGEADADAKLKKIGGSAWATQGRGLYVTTSKSQAKGYGDVRTMTMEDLPKNPIRFRDELAFNEWRGFVARELGFRNVNEFENKVSPFADVWIRKFDPSIDGVQIGTGHGAYFVKFPHEPQSTASAGSEKLFQSAPTFYSELARQVDGLNVKSAPAQGWKDLVKGLVGKGKVKQAEIEATGLDDWLDLQPGKVSKEQVQEFLKNNGVTVEEVELGKSGASADITALERKYPDAVLADASNGKQGPMSDADFQTWQRATRRVRETEPSKFDKYQLPGGENYRELLLTLPPAPLDLPAVEKLKQLPEGYEVIVDRSQPAHEQWGVIPPGQIHARLFAGRYANEAEAIRGALDKLNYEAQKKATDEAYKNQDGQQFRSNHFDQPNILAHVRFNERTDADGKRVLFLEELQSDWAQKGRKEGFALSSEEVERIRGPIRNTYEKYGAWPTAEMMPAEEWAAFNAAQDESDRLNLSSIGKDNRVPSAPFVGKTEAWTALALKRMIRYAAENGFDRIAWTNGEQQADRYDLSKQISRIVLHDNSSGGIGAPKMEGEFTGGNLTAYDHSGQAVIDRRYIQTARELEDQIGKEAAEKLLKATPAERRLAGIGLREKEISGLDLKVGGEGMKGFYDKIVPAVANDVLKKLGGGKVGTVDLGPIEGTNEYGESIDESVTPSESGIQPGFDITPALREKVMAGQPLFQDNRGYLQFGPGSKMSIGLLASADRSTFLHESGHFFLEVMNDLSKEIPALQGEMETVFKWLGVKDADAWSTMSLDEKRPYHEQWARGFEAYLMEGKAPNERLKSAFARFRDWLIEVYKSAVNLNVTLSDEVRGVMDRMLDSQAAHPSEPPRAPAEGAGTPPPGKVGEAPAARSDLDQALAAGKPNLTAPRGLEHPDIRETLQDMAANETGWAEVGGRMLRIPDASMESGERIDRTKWIPKEEWWAARPGPKRLNEAQVQEAVRKALAGEPMNAAEKRTVEFMREVANDRLDSVQQIGEERFGEMLEDAQLEDLPPTTENAFDSMTARRAYDLDLEAYEAAVDRYNVHEDDGLFMAEVRSIIHEAEQQRGAGSQDHPGGAAERGARPGEADPAAESAGQRSAPRDYVSTEAERIATDNPERRVHVGLDADDKPLTVTAREFLDNARKEADRIRQDANLFQIAGECLLSQL